MAVTQGAGAFSGANQVKLATPDRYIDLNDYLSEVSAPDNRSALVETFGNEDLTGFLKLTNAITNVGTANEVTWWEKTRLMPTQPVASAATAATAMTKALTYGSTALINVRVGDVVIMPDGETRAYVKTVGTGTVTVAAFDDPFSTAAIASGTLKIVGNMYDQGTDQPTEYFESNVNKLTNGFVIIKDTYKVTGSEATNISWVELPGGDKRWFLQGQRDTNQKFKNYIESMLMLAKKIGTAATGDIFNGTGSEGLFSAIESRGLVSTKVGASAGSIVTDLDAIIDELDNQGAVSDEYAAYLSRDQENAINNGLAYGLATGLTNGLPSQFGLFNNDENMAIKLGFKSFSRGGRTFHMKSWKLLNESTMLKGTKFKGVLVPVGLSLDPVSGKYAPPLEMNYKSQPGENRLMKSWAVGSVLGARNSTLDATQFNYLAEVNLVTRAANQFVLIKY